MAADLCPETEKNSKQPHAYGLIGERLTHSFSKQFFTEKFQKESIDATYELFELPKIEDFKALIASRRLSGLNVTIPYKERIIPYLDVLDETAQQVGAVNVIKFVRVGHTLQLHGYNSDVIGFRESVRPLLKPHHTHALLLGTGGAAKAVAFALRQLGVQVQFVSRTKSDLALPYNELTPDIMKRYTVVVNATLLGMYPAVETMPALPYEELTPNHLVYDVVYNPRHTQFMQQATAFGAVTKGGLEMLHLQALAAWEIWNN